MVPSASPPDQFGVLSLLLDQIAADLAQDYNALRIKKLLFCVCTGTWETDHQQLEQLALHSLLQHLLELSPSFEALQQRINQVVATLNKSAEYTIVANSVIGRLLPIYAELQQRQTASRSLYCTVAQQLEQSPDCRRIKKLLLLICRSTWESNSAKLEQLSLLELVQELHQIAPSPDSLRVTLHQVAKALSKPAEYAQVADLISTVLQPLYQSGDSCGPEDEPDTEVRQSGEQTEFTQTQPTLNPRLIPSGPLPTAPASGGDANSLAAKPVAAKPVAARPLAASLSGEPEAETSVASLNRVPLKLVNPSSPPASGPIGPVAPPSQRQRRSRSKSALKVLTLAQPYTTADLFDLRLKLVQNTNPLKAKIVLFSLLHEPFQESAEHETLLKTHELDDLLRILFLSYQHYTDLEASLRQILTSLTHDDYGQAAEVILKTVQPFYASLAASAEATSLKAVSHERTLPEFD